MENSESSVCQNNSNDSTISSVIDPTYIEDKKLERKRFSDLDEDNTLQLKYPRTNTEEIKPKAYDNMNKFYNISQNFLGLNKTLNSNPQTFGVPKYNNINSFRSPPPLSKSFISSSSAKSNVKLDEIYPISKGEIHKISEEPPDPEISLESLEKSTHYTTIVNCPRDNTYGARLLSKMGWHFGEGLGKDGDGIVKAMKFETKIDRRGLATAVEKTQSKIKKPEVDKNPVSILMEYCQKNKISPPIYEDVEQIGPTNMRQFKVSFSSLLIQSRNLLERKR